MEQYRERKIHQIDPGTGAILCTIESNRFVTGVTWVDGELWHGTAVSGQASLIDPSNGSVLAGAPTLGGSGEYGVAITSSG